MNVLTGPLLSGSKIEEQIERERDSIRAGVERYWDLVNDAVDKGGGASLKPAERLLKHWFEPTVAMIAVNMAIWLIMPPPCSPCAPCCAACSSSWSCGPCT